MVDLWRDFWIRETGTGQQLAQLYDIDDDDDDDMLCFLDCNKYAFMKLINNRSFLKLRSQFHVGDFQQDLFNAKLFYMFRTPIAPVIKG